MPGVRCKAHLWYRRSITNCLCLICLLPVRAFSFVVGLSLPSTVRRRHFFRVFFFQVFVYCVYRYLVPGIHRELGICPPLPQHGRCGVNPPRTPQSRFVDKLLINRVNCPHIWECGAKGVKALEIILEALGSVAEGSSRSMLLVVVFARHETRLHINSNKEVDNSGAPVWHLHSARCDRAGCCGWSKYIPGYNSK